MKFSTVLAIVGAIVLVVHFVKRFVYSDLCRYILDVVQPEGKTRHRKYPDYTPLSVGYKNYRRMKERGYFESVGTGYRNYKQRVLDEYGKMPESPHNHLDQEVL